MEKKEQIDPTEELNQAMNEFENENPLNLTDGEKDDDQEDPEFSAKLQGEYEKFMNEMKSGGLESEEGLDGLADALGGLLKGLTDSFGMDGKESEDFKNLLGGKVGEGENMEDLAGKLLQVFMKKELLQEPLLESKANYEKFFKKEEGKIPAHDLKRFEDQYNTIKLILNTLDIEPDNKTKLMELFEKMQDYGQPPAGIVSVSLPGGM